jgi:hypothetical protein
MEKCSVKLIVELESDRRVWKPTWGETGKRGDISRGGEEESESER